MSCGCGTCNECLPEQPATITTTGCTFCDRDRVDNVWVEGADAGGNGGICMLDNLNRAQIVGIIKADDRARADLLRVTSNAELLKLAETIERLPTHQPDDRLQTQMNVNKQAESIPFFAIFRGQPPFAQ